MIEALIHINVYIIIYHLMYYAKYFIFIRIVKILIKKMLVRSRQI
jgi:hypothetical protein